MLNIISYNLKKQLKGTIIYLVTLVGIVWMYVSLFPTIQKFDIQSMMSQMPEQFAGFLGSEGIAAYGKIEGYLSSEFFKFFFVLLIGFYVASVAGSAIAGALEKKTLDFDLSQPVSRTKRLVAETIVAMIYSLFLVSATNIAVKLLCELYNIDISGQGLFFLTIVATLFAWALYGIAIFLSSLIRSKITVVGITIFFTLGSYIFYSLSLAVEKIKDYGKFTLYNFYDPQQILTKSEINLEHCLVLFLVFAVGTTLALIIFNKKDV